MTETQQGLTVGTSAAERNITYSALKKAWVKSVRADIKSGAKYRVRFNRKANPDKGLCAISIHFRLRAYQKEQEEPRTYLPFQSFWEGIDNVAQAMDADRKAINLWGDKSAGPVYVIEDWHMSVG